MKLTELTIGRKFNLGNYESLEVRITVSPEAKEEQLQFEEAIQEITSKLDEKIKELGSKLK